MVACVAGNFSTFLKKFTAKYMIEKTSMCHSSAFQICLAQTKQVCSVMNWPVQPEPETFLRCAFKTAFEPAIMVQLHELHLCSRSVLTM
jgi:hypothetical protein